jgi:hypothetical protein
MRTTAEPSPGRRPPPLHRILHGYRRRASGPGQVAVPPGFLHRRFITSHGTPPRKPSSPPRRFDGGGAATTARAGPGLHLATGRETAGYY